MDTKQGMRPKDRMVTVTREREELIARLMALSGRYDMTATERYEADAEAFYRETGYLSPGKDVPMAMGGQDERERRNAYDVWSAKRNQAQQAAILEAAVALASDPPGLYRQGQEDMRRRVLDIVRDPSDCRIVKKLPIWGVPGMSEAAAAVAPLVERAQQATGGSDASDFRMRQSDPPGLAALLKEPHYCGTPRKSDGTYALDTVMVSAKWYERLKALALPASPQTKKD